MKKRIFVAIAIPATLQQEMEEFQQRFDYPVRWIAGKNMHITLVPPWHTEDVEDVKERLRRLEKHKPFEISLNTVAFGPTSRDPRLIWAEGPTTKKILDLQEHVESALGAHDERSFKLHVTLARFNLEQFRPTESIREKVDWSFTVTSIVLMESHLSKNGSDYEILEEIKFQ